MPFLHIHVVKKVDGSKHFASTVVDDLATAMNVCSPEEWKFLIDSLKLSVKAVLLSNGQVMPSFPAGYKVNVNESYGIVKLLLN
jgi:uncharacterized membrane protein